MVSEQLTMDDVIVAGDLYDADEPEAPICAVLKLHNLDPMQLPRIWSAVRDALLNIPAKQAGSTKV